MHQNIQPAPVQSRLDFRLRKDIKAKIEEAAYLSGQSVSEFAVSTLLKTAEEILERQRTIQMTERDFERFSALIEDETEPNAALRQAAARYRERRA